MDIQAARKRCEAATCQNPRFEPAEYVTHDMAIDAGEPTMQGTLLRGEIREPCGDCDGCYLRDVVPAALEALEEAQGKLGAVEKAANECGVACYMHTVLRSKEDE